MYLILDYTCPATIRNQSRIKIAPTACTSRKRCLCSAVNGKITFMKIAATFTDPTVAAIGLRNVANLLINYAHFRNSSLAELTAPIKSSRLNFIFTLSGRMYKSTKNSICILSFPPSLSITHSLCPSKLSSAIRCSRPISPTKSILNFVTPFTLLRTRTYKQILSLSPTSDLAIKSKHPPFSGVTPNPLP